MLLVGGFFRSLQFTAINALSYSDIAKRAMSTATSLYSVAQQLSLAAGVVCAAFVLEMAQLWRGELTVEPDDFTVAFVVVAILGLVSVRDSSPCRPMRRQRVRHPPCLLKRRPKAGPLDDPVKVIPARVG